MYVRFIISVIIQNNSSRVKRIYQRESVLLLFACIRSSDVFYWTCFKHWMLSGPMLRVWFWYDLPMFKREKSAFKMGNAWKKESDEGRLSGDQSWAKMLIWLPHCTRQVTFMAYINQDLSDPGLRFEIAWPWVMNVQQSAGIHHMKICLKGNTSFK